MRLFSGVLAAIALLAASASPPVLGTASHAVERTRLVRWSPFDAAGNIRAGLSVTRQRGGCGRESELIGSVGYRCGYGQFIVDPCWRDGPERTDLVVCAGTPWKQSVLRLRVPKLLFDDGVTFGAIPHRPWALELVNGDRCRHYTGAYAAGRGQPQVAYHCESGVDLLMNLRRSSPLWTIGSARYVQKRNRYDVLSRVAIRTAFLPGLPDGMAREHDLASRAAAFAERAVRRASGTRRTYFPALRVRLALPAGKWAHVHGMLPRGPRFWNLLLRRTGDRWSVAKLPGTSCPWVPLRVQRQLFDRPRCDE